MNKRICLCNGESLLDKKYDVEPCIHAVIKISDFTIGSIRDNAYNQVERNVTKYTIYCEKKSHFINKYIIFCNFYSNTTLDNYQ